MRQPGLNPEQVKPETTSQRQSFENFSARLRDIARQVSGDYELSVEPGEPGDPWRFNQITQRVYFDPQEVIDRGEVGKDVLKGSIAHEAGHRIISKTLLIPEEQVAELGFHAVLAAAEERPTDQVVRDRFPGAGAWVNEMRRVLSNEGHAEAEKTGPGNFPKFAQLTDLIVYAPHMTEEQLRLLDPEVLQLYADKLRPIVEDIEHTLPDPDMTEAEVEEVAKRRYKKVYEQLWPEIKAFAKQDLDLEKLHQMILKMMLKMLATPEGIKQLINQIKKSMSKISGGPQAPMKSLSPEQIRALQQAYQSLSKDEKDKITAAATKVLEDIEDGITKQFSPVISETPPLTHARMRELEEERRKGQRELEEREKNKKSMDKRVEDVEARLAALRPTASAYEEVYQQVHEYDEELYQRLEEIFHPSIKKKVKLTSTGSRLNLPALFRWEANRAVGNPAMSTRIFERVHLPEKKDYAISLLVDLSGSMYGEKIEETFKGVVLLTEVLNRLGVKVEILGFQDQIIRFKDFDEELSDAVRKKMSGMILEVSDENPGGHNNAMYNDDGPAVDEASRRLNKQSAKQKFLVVFSDGVPAGRRSNQMDLYAAIKRVLTKTDQKLIAVGLGPYTDHVAKYYPTSLPNTRMQDFSAVLGALLEDIISFPEKYRYQIPEEGPVESH